MGASNEHIAITSPDARGRFYLRKYLGAGVDDRFRVYLSDDHRTLTLSLVEEDA